MQDRYAGDVGDFLKLGLLRYLVAATDSRSALRLGVVWYRVPDEAHNADGKHVAYLSSATPTGRALSRLDPDLYLRLADVLSSGDRTVAALERADVLPTGCASFNDELTFDQLSSSAKQARIAHRKAWMSRALAAVDGCDVVFADPDNGIRRDDHKIPLHRTKSVKHAYFDELRQFIAREQSVVVYHHADRSTTVEQQAQLRLADANQSLGVEPLAAVRASRGTNRLFLVLPVAKHRSDLEARLHDLQQSRWSSELIVYWWDRAPRSVVEEAGGEPGRGQL